MSGFKPRELLYSKQARNISFPMIQGRENISIILHFGTLSTTPSLGSYRKKSFEVKGSFPNLWRLTVFFYSFFLTVHGGLFPCL
jgi:hypothetical protein